MSEDEKSNEREQFEAVSARLDALRKEAERKGVEFDEGELDAEELERYRRTKDAIDNLDVDDIRNENLSFDDKMRQYDLDLFKEIEEAEKKQKASLARKRAGRKQYSRGSGKQSPFFDDD